MIDEKRHQEAEALMDRGFELLDEYEAEEALEVGLRLRELRHSSGFEILALAYDQLEERQKAIEVLEDGVGHAPAAWPLWLLLGNYYSDEGRYADAQQCYETALGCPGIDASSVHLNSAIAYNRASGYQEALQQHRQITNPDYALRAVPVQMDALIGLGRYDEALELGGGVLDRTGEDEERREELSMVCSSMAWALYRKKHRNKALQYAWEALRLDKLDEDAAWLVRELEDTRAANARYYRVLVEGIWPFDEEDDEGPLGFYTTYDVVAESPEHALELIKRFEPPEARESLTIEDAEEIERRPDDLIGVYRTNPYSLFPLDDED